MPRAFGVGASKLRHGGSERDARQRQGQAAGAGAGAGPDIIFDHLSSHFLGAAEGWSCHVRVRVSQTLHLRVFVCGACACVRFQSPARANTHTQRKHIRGCPLGLRV